MYETSLLLKKKMTTKTREVSKQQLLEAVRKKRECNARAQAIVESLLERNNDCNEFLVKVKNINQSHYEDIVDERHILRLCGYPLCERALENVPSKKFQISTMVNKVYDITDRKKYCSTQCFKASEYIKLQMLTSPLWARNQETIPHFKLLSIDSCKANRSFD